MGGLAQFTSSRLHYDKQQFADFFKIAFQWTEADFSIVLAALGVGRR